MSDVFISYSRKDKEFAQRLAEALEATGRDSWVDWHDIPYSADWWREICTGIDAADAFLFIISPDSLRSMVCNKEVEYARKQHKRIIPLMHRDVVQDGKPFADIVKAWYGEEWEQAAEANWQEVQRLNWLFFRAEDNFDIAFSNLLQTAEQDLAHIRMHTRLLVRALEWNERGRESSFLLTGNEINESEHWLAVGVEKEPLPTQLHAEYINASRTAANRRQQMLITGILIALIATIGLSILAAVFGIDARNQSEIARANEIIAIDNASTALAEEQRANDNAADAATQAELAESNAATAIAEQQRADEQARLAISRQLAVQSSASLNDNLGTALLLAVESHRTANTFEAHESLLRALQAHPSLIRYLPTLGGEVVSVATSPGGKFMAYGDENGMVRLFETATGRAYGLPMEDFGRVIAVHFLDDKRLLTATVGETLTAWDVESGREVAFPRTGILTESTSVLFEGVGEQDAAFTANGDRLVTLDTTNGIAIYDTATGEQLEEIQPSEGNMLTVASDFDNSLSDISVHPTAQYVMATGDAILKLFSVNDDAAELILEKVDVVFPVGNFSADGQYVAWYNNPSISSSDGSIEPVSLQVMELEAQEVVASIPLDSYVSGFVTTIAFDSQSEVIFLGTDDGNLLAINFATSELDLSSMGIHIGGVNALATDASRNWIFTAGDDGRVAVVDPKASSQLFQPLPDHTTQQSLMQIATRTTDNVLLGWSLDAFYLFDYATGAAIVPPFSPADGIQIAQTALHPTEEIVASLSVDSDRVQLWDFSSGQFEQIMDAKHPDVSHITFSADGNWLISHGSDETFVWDVAERELAAQDTTELQQGMLAFDSGIVFSSTFHPQDNYLLTAGVTLDLMRAWQVTAVGLDLLPDIQFEVPEEYSIATVWDLTFSPDGNYLAATTYEGLLFIWQVSTGSLVTEPIRVTDDLLRRASFEPDGRTLAVLTDTEIHLFDRITGRRFGTPIQINEESFFSDASFAPNGETLLLIENNQLYSWPFDVELWAEAACARANLVWDQETWARFVSDVPYRLTCPQVALAEADDLALRNEAELATQRFEQLVTAANTYDDLALQVAICRVGALSNLSQIILPACEQAVSLAPDDTSALDSRGIAYALIGEFDSALGDFERAMALSEDDDFVDQRADWVAQLEQGTNPFDDVLRRQLRNTFASTTTYLVASVPEINMLPERRPLSPDEITSAIDALALPFEPLTFSENTSPVPGWSITRTLEADYEELGFLKETLVPGERGIRMVVSSDSDEEQSVGMLQSEGTYGDVHDWTNNMGFFLYDAQTEILDVNSIEVVHKSDAGTHFYFFIYEGIHVAIGYYSEGMTFDQEIDTFLADLIR